MSPTPTRTETEDPPDVLLRYCLTTMAMRTERMLPHIVRHMPEYAFLLPACELIAKQRRTPPLGHADGPAVPVPGLLPSQDVPGSA